MSRVLEDEARSPRDATSPHGLCLWGSVAGFVAIGIGWPLVGRGVFAPTDLLATRSPYAETVLAGVTPGNPFLQNVADGVIPQPVLFVDLVMNGCGGAWNPFMPGGVPLGAIPDNAALAGHLGADRCASPPDTLRYGESSVHRGHAFTEERMGELIEALPGRQYRDPPAPPATAPTAPVVTGPIMDRLSVRYVVASPKSPVLGTPGQVTAVAVGSGTHTARLTYTTPFHGAGTWLSAATGASLCALVVVYRWWRRRQYTTTGTEPNPES